MTTIESPTTDAADAVWAREARLMQLTHSQLVSEIRHRLDTGSGQIQAPFGAADVGNWEGEPDELPHRFVSTPDAAEEGSTVGEARQYADGRIESPKVYIELPLGRGISTVEARELAGAMIDICNQLDGWARIDNR